MTGIERSIRRARITCLAAALAIPLGAFLFGTELAAGSPLAPVPAACVVALLVLVVAQVRLIGSMQRVQELNQRADQLELAAAAVKSQARPCAHPDAEPVDLSTGERVAWVCPDCDAELLAGWTPARRTGALTATGTMDMPAASALSGSGTLSAEATASGCQCGDSDVAEVRVPESAIPVARYCRTCLQLTYPPAEVRTGELRAAFRDFKAAIEAERQATAPKAATWDDVAYASEASEHFAQLARVGRESCVSPCSICEKRWLDEGRFLSAQDDDVAVTSPRAPDGAHDYRIDGAGREWYRDSDDLWWIKPTPDSPWFRQNKPGGGEQR